MKCKIFRFPSSLYGDFVEKEIEFNGGETIKELLDRNNIKLKQSEFSNENEILVDINGNKIELYDKVKKIEYIFTKVGYPAG